MKITIPHHSTWKPPNKISPQDYLQILFNDLLYDRLHRNDKLSVTFGRKICFIDELTPQETSAMIEILREQKGTTKHGTDEND